MEGAPLNGRPDTLEVDECLARAKKLFPDESVRDYELSYVNDYGAIESSSEWQTEDLSSRIDTELSLRVEMDSLYRLANRLWKPDSEERRNFTEALSPAERLLPHSRKRSLEFEAAIDSLTSETYLDRRNFNHVVSALTDVHGTSFNVETQINTGIDGALYLEAGANPWMANYPCQPLVVFKSSDDKSRDFFEKSFCAGIDWRAPRDGCSIASKIDEAGNLLGYYVESHTSGLRSVQTNHHLYALLFLGGLPIFDPGKSQGISLTFTAKTENQSSGYSWKEASSAILDLRAKKFYVRLNQLGEGEVKKKTGSYRKILEEIYGVKAES